MDAVAINNLHVAGYRSVREVRTSFANRLTRESR